MKSTAYVDTEALSGVLTRMIGEDIGATQLRIMLLLLHEGTQPMKSLCSTTFVSSAAITGAVDRMEERRLVIRSRKKGDRRMIYVTLTQDGTDALHRILRPTPEPSPN